MPRATALRGRASESAAFQPICERDQYRLLN
jgi:hypothetical protein